MSEIPEPPASFPSTVQQGAAFPPTVQQGRAAADDFPSTTYQGAGAAPGLADAAGFPSTVQQFGPGSPGAAAGKIPDELAGRYEQRNLLGSGAEGTVWLVRRIRDGREFALKVHLGTLAEQVNAYLGVLAHLDNPRFSRHVPHIEEYGTAATPAGAQVWVVMEYLAEGTLSDLISQAQKPGGGVPEPLARDIVLELAEAVHFWQTTVNMNPLDLKPANFMVRRASPRELVVTDFGGVVRMTLSQQYGVAVTTHAYMPPEGLAEWRAEPWPWWAVGEIAYELVTGRARFDLRDISRGVAKRLILQDRAVGQPDLSAVRDPRWRLLISGLLTRSPLHRWTYDQIRDWSAGQSPPVYDTAAPGRSGPAKAPILFQHDSYHDPVELAAAFADQSAAAAGWLQGAGRDALLRWLDAEPKDAAYPRDYLYGLSGPSSDRRAHRAVTAFIATYLPEQPPSYRGTTIDRDGLVRLARQGSEGEQVITEMLDDGILQIAAGCGCGHLECAGRCRVLDEAARDEPAITTAVEAAVAKVGEQVSTAGDGAAWKALSTAERVTIRARAVELTVAPEHKNALLQPAKLIAIRDVTWWPAANQAARRADVRTTSGRAAVITALVLASRAPAVFGAQEARERRAREVREAPRRRVDRRAAWWALAIAITVAGPLYLGRLWWHGHLMSVATSPPPDPRAIPGGAKMLAYAPEYLFGFLILLGLLGLVFLRPPWTRGRVPFALLGVVLAGLGVSAPWLADATANTFSKDGWHSYTRGPIPASALGQTCGTYWTSSLPVNGSYRRWALVNPDGSGDCTTIAGYAGWRQMWSVTVHGADHYATLGSYPDGVLIAVKQGGAGALVAYSEHKGRELWRWQCPASQTLSSWTFHGINNHTKYSSGHPFVQATCQDQNGDNHTYPLAVGRTLQ
jgi:hypothetical protein